MNYRQHHFVLPFWIHSLARSLTSALFNFCWVFVVKIVAPRHLFNFCRDSRIYYVRRIFNVLVELYFSLLCYVGNKVYQQNELKNRPWIVKIISQIIDYGLWLWIVNNKYALGFSKILKHNARNGKENM